MHRSSSRECSTRTSMERMDCSFMKRLICKTCMLVILVSLLRLADQSTLATIMSLTFSTMALLTSWMRVWMDTPVMIWMDQDQDFLCACLAPLAISRKVQCECFYSSAVADETTRLFLYCAGGRIRLRYVTKCDDQQYDLLKNASVKKR
mmetsp:Transcript_15849/g.23545  ORF Transcript_15849/g.23545 Transcript_15849/m.23545 type:complete len:149 (-) Transcript_15849:32-478(-)